MFVYGAPVEGLGWMRPAAYFGRIASRCFFCSAVTTRLATSSFYDRIASRDDDIQEHPALPSKPATSTHNSRFIPQLPSLDSLRRSMSLNLDPVERTEEVHQGYAAKTLFKRPDTG
jgi:hypothetical protein